MDLDFVNVLSLALLTSFSKWSILFDKVRHAEAPVKDMAFTSDNTIRYGSDGIRGQYAVRS